MSLQSNYEHAITNENASWLMERHSSTRQGLKVLAPNPNLPKHLANISQAFFDLAITQIEDIPDGPELSAGLRKLVEAKDCFVRAALDV